MSRPKSSKIFIKDGNNTNALMWATVGTDDSVMMGFPWSSTESVELVMDKELGSLRKEEIFSTEFAGSSKINFHRSGSYKLSCEMGKNESSTDRVTVEGTPLANISTPLRMAEILIPSKIPNSKYQPTKKDIILDITEINSAPTRCTIGCMNNAEFKKLLNNEGPMVDTSAWEAWNVLATESHTWVWVLRKSKNDLHYPSKFFVTLLGNPKWGQNEAAY
jgi:hypothetical protein